MAPAGQQLNTLYLEWVKYICDFLSRSNVPQLHPALIKREAVR